MEKVEIYLKSNLLYLLFRKNISQKQIAIALGESSSTINNWCKGKSRPDYEKIIPLIRYLDIPIEDFLIKDLSKNQNYIEDSIKMGNVQESESEYRKNTEGVVVELIESERQLYERIIKSKDELIEYLKFDNEQLKQKK